MLLTYKKINSAKHLESLINESFKLISKHQNKASSIVETEIKTLNNKTAKIIDIKGEVQLFPVYNNRLDRKFHEGCIIF